MREASEHQPVNICTVFFIQLNKAMETAVAPVSAAEGMYKGGNILFAGVELLEIGRHADGN